MRLFQVLLGLCLALPAQARNFFGNSRRSVKQVCPALERGFANALRQAYPGANAQRVGASLLILDRRTGQLLCQSHHRAQEIFYPASSIKTLIALAVLKKVDRNEIGLNDLVTIQQRNAEAEEQYWGPEYGQGKSVSLSKLLIDMIVISNNTATNQLIDVAGKDFISQTAAELGAPQLQVHRKVYTGSVPAEDPIPPRANQATPADLAGLYAQIVSPKRAGLSEASHGFLVKLLGDQSFHDRLDKNFPPEVPFFHKPGNTSQVAADGGFFYFNDGTSVAVLTALQAFPDYEPLQKFGKAALDLVLSTAKP